MLPSTKIDISLNPGIIDRQIIVNSSSQPSGHSSYTNKTVMISVIIAPISSADLKLFIQQIDLIAKDKTAPFAIDSSELSANMERSLVVTIEDQYIEIVSNKLSKLREVLWIEQRHLIQSSNKWASSTCEFGLTITS